MARAKRYKTGAQWMRELRAVAFAIETTGFGEFHGSEKQFADQLYGIADYLAQCKEQARLELDMERRTR